MPDPLKKTISATQMPALFDASPYITRWMLYRWFKFGDPIDSPEHNRMDWGKKMESLLLAQAVEDLHFEVRPNSDADGKQVYIRNGLLGCTRDAQIICPDRGPGALETKCVFDYQVWMREWAGGKTPPRQNEIQLQQQMKVGDGEGSPPYKWGVLAVWCGGDMKYFERKPMPDLWASFDAEAAQFFADVEAGKEPDPFGAVVERELLAEAFPTVIGQDLDLSNPATDEEFNRAIRIAEQARMCNWHGTERLGHERAEKKLKAELHAIAKDNERILLPFGIQVTVKQSPRAGYVVNPTTTTSIKVFVPDNLPEGKLTREEHADAAATSA